MNHNKNIVTSIITSVAVLPIGTGKSLSLILFVNVSN